MQKFHEAPSQPTPHLIATGTDAGQALADLEQVMDGLKTVVEQETELVGTGRLSSARELQSKKAELARRYCIAAERLKGNAAFIGRALPTSLGTLRPQHDALHAALQKNLMVLATAHAVSEGIVRRLSGDLARKAAPQTYGASGRTAGLNPKLAQPLALSRFL
jgi:hypothetical protein